jgi:hypothetical protein
MKRKHKNRYAEAKIYHIFKSNKEEWPRHFNILNKHERPVQHNNELKTSTRYHNKQKKASRIKRIPTHRKTKELNVNCCNKNDKKKHLDNAMKFTGIR